LIVMPLAANTWAFGLHRRNATPFCAGVDFTVPLLFYLRRALPPDIGHDLLLLCWFFVFLAVLLLLRILME
jgi:hypothetical protein